MSDSEKKETGMLERVDNFVRGLANGATFGAADYFAGAMDTVVENANNRINGRQDDSSLQENMNRQVNRSNKGLLEHPIEGSVALGVGGALTGLVGTSRAMGVAAIDNVTNMASLVKGSSPTAGAVYARTLAAQTRVTTPSNARAGAEAVSEYTTHLSALNTIVGQALGLGTGSLKTALHDDDPAPAPVPARRPVIAANVGDQLEAHGFKPSMDRNHDGQIDMNEIRATFRQHGLTVGQVDKNGDGVFNAREVSNAINAAVVRARDNGR